MTLYIPEGINTNASPNITFNLNSFGAVGTYIDVTFSGTYDDFNGNNHSITGTVHV